MTDGFLLVDKESGFTSHDVVALARKKMGTKKIGHAGTLDPMATGLLVLGVGIGTKLLSFIVDGAKSYEATIRLGASTSTDDKDGEIIEIFEIDQISDDEILKTLETFKGKIAQRPSSVSAIKIGGKRAHELVRAGVEVDIPEREVEIFRLDALGIKRAEKFIDIDVNVRCSSGTYIRSIARDLGVKLGNGGHLTKLNRSEVAPFSLSEAKLLAESKLISIKIGIERILPTRVLEVSEAKEIFFGRPIEKSESELTAAFLANGDFAALLTNKSEGDKVLAFPSLVNVKE